MGRKYKYLGGERVASNSERLTKMVVDEKSSVREVKERCRTTGG